MRTALIDTRFMHDGLPVASYVTQLLAAEFAAQGPVLVITTYPSRVREAGTIHRSWRGAVPVAIIESGPPGATSSAAAAAVRRAFQAVLAAYPPDTVHVIGEPDLLDVETIRQSAAHAAITLTQVCAGPDPHLEILGLTGEGIRVGIPTRGRGEQPARAIGSPRLGALASHLPHPDAWTGLREGLSLLDRSDFDFRVTGDTGAQVQGHWPCAGLLRPMPLRHVADLEGFLVDLDVLLWPALAADTPGYAVPEAVRRGISVVLVGDAAVPPPLREQYGEILVGDGVTLSKGLASVIDAVHEGSAGLGHLASTTDIQDAVAALDLVCSSA